MCRNYVFDLLDETEGVAPEVPDDEESSPLSAFLFFRFPSMTAEKVKLHESGRHG